MKLEYIASGVSFCISSQFQKINSKPHKAKVSEIAKAMNNLYDYHAFGVLYNGYSEPDDGEWHKEYFSPFTVQVDSGGLQMVTRGHTPNDAMREAVYRNQAKYGTIGMCFDEIPVQVIGKGQMIHGDMRRFDRSMINDCAKQTAKNIVRQIEVFEEEKSDCKPFMIIQGNDFETYQEWSDILLKHIPKSLHERLAGIATSGVCLGDGELEDIERFFTMSRLEAPEHLQKHFHLLGIGSPNRIQTLIKLEHFFDKDTLVSYDSTKHTGGIVRGQVQLDHRIVPLGRHRGEDYWKIWHRYDDFQRKFGLNFSESLFHDALLLTSEERYAKLGQPDDNPQITADTILLRYSVMMFSVYNLFNFVEYLKKHKHHISKSKRKYEAVYRTLEQVKTVDDFKKWKIEYGRYLDSERRKSVEVETPSLEEFFA